jgi:hypothetical protein
MPATAQVSHSIDYSSGTGPDSTHESGSYRYELTGVAGPAKGIRTGNDEHAGSEFVITAGDLAMVARTAAPMSEVAAGSRITAQCTMCAG